MTLIVKMENFNKRKGDIVKESEAEFEPIIKEWAELIFRNSQKGLTPLFITGSGVSNEVGVPDITQIIKNLKEISLEGNGNYKKEIPQDISTLFTTWEQLNGKNKKDRSVVARLLNAFQERNELKNIWQDMNKRLLGLIQKATPSFFHQGLAGLYEDVGAVCLTLNFDGLLIKELIKTKKAFSLPKKEDCENFFLRLKQTPLNNREFVEIQVRGDILYLECQTKDYCPQKGPQPMWTFSNLMKKEDIIKCPGCGGDRVSYLSFPGSYEKEKAMREILEVVWRYLAFRVGSITVVGMSGGWDPMIIAFLGDLLSERDIPLLIVDAKPYKDKTFIIRELVVPKIHDALALEKKADTFMSSLKGELNNLKNKPDSDSIDFGITSHPDMKDDFWDDKEVLYEDALYQKINSGFSEIEIKILKHKHIQDLEKSAQLGLKSLWLDIDFKKEKHDRYHHSLGVMKIASYIYDEAINNSSLTINHKEKQFLRIAALLHDIGHLPFSHLIEEVFNELNWKPAGYISSFSHVLHTEEKIKGMADVTEEIQKLGYEVSDLVRLVNGNCGIGYLDAIINSPIDADKIDYVFADTHSTKRKISLSPLQFLKDIVNGLEITPEKLLAFSGVSAQAVRDLLYNRRHLYQNLYLQPGIRVLEGIVKQIIITYFVHILTLDNEEIYKKTSKKNSPDLGHYKILYCINKIEELIEVCSEEKLKEANNNLELAVLTSMHDELDKLPLNGALQKSLKNGFETIKKVKGEDDLKELESRITFVPFDKDDYYEKMVKIAKTCKLRMPGAIIIEVVKAPKFFSIPDERKKKKRSDDTDTFSECILVPSGKHDTWYPNQDAQQPLLSSSLNDEEKKGFQVYLYPLSKEESYVSHAMNLFKKLREQENLPMETD